MKKLILTAVIGLSAFGGASVSHAYDRAADTAKVQKGLESKAVRDRLKELGLPDKDIDAKLNQLSDKQLHQLAKNVDTIASGGSIGLIGAILLVVLIAILL